MAVAYAAQRLEQSTRAGGAASALVGTAEIVEVFADTAHAALRWIAAVAPEQLVAPTNALFQFLAMSEPSALRDLVPSALDRDLVDKLATKFTTNQECGRALLQAFRCVGDQVLNESSVAAVISCVGNFPGIALRILDVLQCNAPGVLEAALSVYTGSMLSTDRIALRILLRCALPRDSPMIRAWVAATSNSSANSVSGYQARDGEWIFDFLQPDRIAVSVCRFPLRRAVRAGSNDMEDDEAPVDLPDDDDVDVDIVDDEEDQSLHITDEDDQRRLEGGDDVVGEEEEQEEEEDEREQEEYEDDSDDQGEVCDDYEVEDGMSDKDDEESEMAWLSASYDPRFVLPACYHALAETDDEDEDARIVRRAYESGGIAYASAALSSKHSQTRALAAAVLGRFATKLTTGAASMDRGFVARPFVRMILDSTFAALKEASDPLRGPRRLPCLWSCVIARCLDALKSPRHAGFGVAAAHTVRRAISRPWHDAPLVRDAFVNDKGLANFFDDTARDKVRARFWAFECLVDAARDDHDMRSLKRAGAIALSMHCMEELLTGGGAIFEVQPGETKILLTTDGMAPPGALSLLEQHNGEEDLRMLRKINILAAAEGDAAHRVLASIGRSRHGRRLLMMTGAISYLISRIGGTREARDIELTGALLHFATDDLDYFTEERSPLLMGLFDVAFSAVMGAFYAFVEEEREKPVEPNASLKRLSEYSAGHERLGDDEAFDDEFLLAPLTYVSDLGEVRISRGSNFKDAVVASTRFLLRRYLSTRRLALEGIERIGGHHDRLVTIEAAWSITKVIIVACFGERLDLRTAAARLMRTACTHADAAELALDLGPPMVLFLGQQLWFGLRELDPIGNRLFSPMLEFFVALLIARLSLLRESRNHRCLVSLRRQIAATVDAVLRAARIGQGEPAVDMLQAARLEFGIGFGLAYMEPGFAAPLCPLHRVDDLASRTSALADQDRCGPRRGMACSLDVLLADALAVSKNGEATQTILPADVAGLFTYDDILNAPDPPPGDNAHRRALSQIEAGAPTIHPDRSVPVVHMHDPFVRILLEHQRPHVDPKDLVVDVKCCDACLGKIVPPDLEYLDDSEIRWWRVDVTPDS